MVGETIGMVGCMDPATYSFIASLGFRVVAEDVTNKGLVDMTVLAEDKVYFMESKVIPLALRSSR